MLPTVAKAASDIFLSRLRQLRERHGLTQEDFADLSGISYKYYQQMEAGRRRDVRLSTIERVARVYGLEVHQLLAPKLGKTAVRKKDCR